MQAVKLECRTRGFNHGDIVPVGEGENEISLEEATILVSDGHAKEYMLPFINESEAIAERDKAIAERDKAIAERGELIAERDTLIKERNNALAELGMAQAELEAAKDGKNSKSK